ncbi:UNVERIFIED_CONTAM: zinc finger protein [Trichonephila clavipes]
MQHGFLRKSNFKKALTCSHKVRASCLHLRVYTKEKPHVCDICNIAFSQSFSLKKQLRIYSNETSHICEIHNRAFSKISNYVFTPRKSRMFVKNATRLSLKEESLKRHLLIHSSETRHVCEICSNAFSIRRNLKKTFTSSFLCKTSSVNVFTPRKALSLTESLVTYFTKSVKRHVCAICNKAFSQKEKPHVCEVCNKSFFQRVNLKTHLHSHSNQKCNVCEICNTALSQVTDLKSHLLVHTKKKSHVWEITGNLKTYLLIHFNEKCHVCELYNKAFSQISDLKRHLCVHQEEASCLLYM